MTIMDSSNMSFAVPRSILVVDDDPDAREILVRILEKLGERSWSAANGREALNLVAEKKPSLIFMDLMMPEMSGFEAIVQLKREATTRDIPIVIVSAMGSDQRLKRLGATHVILKGNINIPEVKRVLSQILPPIIGESTHIESISSGTVLDIVSAEENV